MKIKKILALKFLIRVIQMIVLRILTVVIMKMVKLEKDLTKRLIDLSL